MESGYQVVDFYGGPLDGEQGALSDGVRMLHTGGYYEAAYVNGYRKLVWHEVHDTTGEGDE